ncbi:MAG: hypothetical protein ACFCGT_01995 [Sandaracinaceae bacterium]
MSTLYSHTIRLLTCRACGAPIEAGPEGGQVRCAYCSTVQVLERRDEAADHARVRQALAQPISESERLAGLRRQDRGPEPVPASLAAYVTDRGGLPPERVPEAQRAWQEARHALADRGGGAAFPIAERLFYLTIHLAAHLEDRPARAMLETAAELLDDARHRHVVRSMLARRAAQHGDRDGARAWLATCIPRPTDLRMDSTYRLAAATLATVERRPSEVLALLGDGSGDVPVADQLELEATLLRLHAREARGEGAAATAAVRALLEDPGVEATDQARRAFAPLTLVPDAYADAAAARTREAAEAKLDAVRTARLRLNQGRTPFVRLTASLPLMAFVLTGFTFTTQCTTELDPSLGAAGHWICPRVCDDCHGPVRTFTAWTQTGPGEWSSDGPEYVCDSSSRPLGAMSSSTIEDEAGELGEQRISGLAVFGGNQLLFMVALLPLIPLLGVVFHLRNAVRAKALDRELRDLAASLGQRPPALDKGCRGPIVALGLAWGAAGLAFSLVALGLAIS